MNSEKINYYTLIFVNELIDNEYFLNFKISFLQKVFWFLKEINEINLNIEIIGSMDHRSLGQWITDDWVCSNKQTQ